MTMTYAQVYSADEATAATQ